MILSYHGIMKTIKTNLDRDEEILRMKREGQARSRALVRDGIKTKDSMFLFPKAVVKAAKIRFRD